MLLFKAVQMTKEYQRESSSTKLKEGKALNLLEIRLAIETSSLKERRV